MVDIFGNRIAFDTENCSNDIRFGCLAFGYLIRSRVRCTKAQLAAAKAAHEANRAYCVAIGDFSQKPWHDAPRWQQDSAISGVRYLVDHPDATPEDIHESWLNGKREAGWSYGPVKDEEKKTHPCFVPYQELPESQKTKDAIFYAVVRGVLAAP